MRAADFEQGLNPEQLAAVTAPDGPMLILAAAGTGKTRTLVHRVAWLVDHGVQAGRILLLTFTNKAAGEMLERADALVGQGVGGLWGGTFHHMANRILRVHAERLGYGRNYAILDRDDTLSLLRQCIRACGHRPSEFVKAEVLASLFSSCANRETDLAEEAEDRFVEHGVEGAAVVRVHGEYEARKRKQNLMDFDDLLVNGLRLFREHPDVCGVYQRLFLYTLVDEYQDTNAIQAQWVDLVAAANRNLFVVGDDFQSIYGWRGADFRNILGFPERYPDARVYRLETNYRSAPEILAVANACIAGNPKQFQKTLRATRESMARPLLAQPANADDQARYVVDQVRRFRREGYRLGDMAVLYRAHFHAVELQLELARSGVEYEILSGVRFFEQAHVKDVCCLLRLLANPADAVSFVRLLCLLPRVGERTADRIWEKLGGRFDPLDAVARGVIGAGVPAVARDEWDRVAELLAGLPETPGMRDLSGLVGALVVGFYYDYAARQFDNVESRMDDLEELSVFLTRYTTLDAFLSEMALLSNVDADERGGGASDEDGERRERLRMSTVHQAKGLEWSVVFVVWAVEGMFPSGRSLAENEEDGEAEERRLFYVAVTRAKDELVVCAPAWRRTRDGGGYPCEVSRFVAEVPGELFRKERTGSAGGMGGRGREYEW